jgi:hypothetical protein
VWRQIWTDESLALPLFLHSLNTWALLTRYHHTPHHLSLLPLWNLYIYIYISIHIHVLPHILPENAYWNVHPNAGTAWTHSATKPPKLMLHVRYSHAN